MMEPQASLFFPAVVFFFVALAYSSVGLGGGSSYIALMAVFGVSHLAIPTVSLILNLLVTSAGIINFARKGHVRIGLILPFLASSIPMAYLGGALALPIEVFYWILLVTLVFVALRIYVFDNTPIRLEAGDRWRIVLSLATGALLGLAAGIVGIGGGIFLVPLIIILGLGTEKEAAACGAVFIWLNSASGLAARLQYQAVDITGFLPLIFAVIIGGIAGSFLGSSRFKPITMERVLGGIVLVTIFLLLGRI